MSDKPKIIIDEDWKSQVEAEKAAASKPSEPSAEESAADTAAAPDDGGSQEPNLDADPPMPPASFSMLISSLASEAMMALGHLPHPVTGEVTPRRNQAKYLIDTIDMLHEKTKGNVEPEETAGVQELLHQLKMAFVQMPAAEKDESK